MKNAVIVTIAAACLALSGCANAAGSASSPAETPSVTSTPTPTPTAATVSQWASKVAESAGKWKKQTTAFAEDCSYIGIVLDGETGTCGIQLITMSATGATIVLTMEQATKDLGAPPAEIADLVKRLSAAGTELEAASDDVPESCPEAGDKKCADKWIRTERAADDVATILNGWTPYL